MGHLIHWICKDAPSVCRTHKYALFCLFAFVTLLLYLVAWTSETIITKSLWTPALRYYLGERSENRNFTYNERFYEPGEAYNPQKGPVLTLFTTWVDSGEKKHVHRAIVRNWMHLYPAVQPVIITNDSSVLTYCTDKGWGALPLQNTLPNGKPFLKEMFLAVLKKYDTPLVAFSNSDIFFTDELVASIKAIITSMPGYLNKGLLIAGTRINVKDMKRSDMASWEDLQKVVNERGTHWPFFWAIDFFITTKFYPWTDFPPVAVGVRDYDNFVLWFARQNNVTTIDVSNTALAVHATTESGNYEGMSGSLPFYNREVLERQYPNFTLRHGYLHCTDYLTGRMTDEARTVTVIHRDAMIGTCTEIYVWNKKKKRSGKSS